MTHLQCVTRVQGASYIDRVADTVRDSYTLRNLYTESFPHCSYRIYSSWQRASYIDLSHIQFVTRIHFGTCIQRAPTLLVSHMQFVTRVQRASFVVHDSLRVRDSYTESFLHISCRKYSSWVVYTSELVYKELPTLFVSHIQFVTRVQRASYLVHDSLTVRDSCEESFLHRLCRIYSSWQLCAESC